MATMVVLPIVKSLLLAAQVVGGGSQEALRPVDATQRMFVDTYVNPGKEQLGTFSEEELRAWASYDIDSLNAILEKAGFSIKLEPKPGSDQLGVVSILDVMVNWLHKGEEGSITAADKKSYPAVALNKGFNMHTAEGHEHPVISIATQGKDTVFMTIADKKYESFELLSRIATIRKALTKDSEQQYDEVLFPMIDYDQKMKLKWLLGLGIGSKSIDQAVQQTKFKMNETGAHVTSAVAISMIESCVRNKSTYSVNEPFFVWVEREGVDAPVFAGYMGHEHWKDPGTVDKE